MASAAYNTWKNKGKPYTLILPARHLQAKIQVYGITVYDYPNEDHLQANLPQDHTPFSATGWPGTNTKYFARALDIMPRNDSATARKENAAIARQLIKDRDAGHPGVAWIKYINWTDEGGRCRQERWTTEGQPNKRTTVNSNDDGHIHISGRSDYDNYTGAESYDPIQRMLGVNMASVLTSNEQRQLSNVDEYEFGKANELDPLPNIKGGSGAIVPVANKPLQRAIRTEEKVDQLLARPVAPPTDDQWQAFTEAVVTKLEELFAQKVGEAAEIAVIDALNRTKLTVQPEESTS